MGPFWARLLYSVRRTYWRICRPRTLGVAALALDAEKRVLLVRNSYRPGWHLPGGGVKRGETVAEAMVRELSEETGVVAAEPTEVWGVFANFADRNYDHVVVFVLRDSELGSLKGRSFEIDEVRAFPLQALPADLGAGTRRRIEEFTSGRIERLIW